VKKSQLILAGAPLGNSRDLSLRVRDLLSQVDLIAAEDTRRLLRLCSDLDISLSAPVVSFFAGNEAQRTPELISALTEGKTVLVITDAGMPGISDPGYLIVRAALDANFEIEVVPGPSAASTALLLSGLSMERYIFDGFPPRTQQARQNYFESIKSESRTVVLFEAPHRIRETLEDAILILGKQRQGAVCREMTKTHEEIVRGSLAELEKWSNSKEMLGEITLVIAGPSAGEIAELTPVEIAAKVKELEGVGATRQEAVAQIATEFGLRKRAIFDALVASKIGQ
jgi:16S rRNA (cytidine1402-2'-O)-methyltransferase